MTSNFEYQLGLAQRTMDKPLQEMIIFGLGEKNKTQLYYALTILTLCKQGNNVSVGLLVILNNSNVFKIRLSTMSFCGFNCFALAKELLSTHDWMSIAG